MTGCSDACSCNAAHMRQNLTTTDSRAPPVYYQADYSNPPVSGHVPFLFEISDRSGHRPDRDIGQTEHRPNGNFGHTECRPDGASSSSCSLGTPTLPQFTLSLSLPKHALATRGLSTATWLLLFARHHLAVPPCHQARSQALLTSRSGT